MNTIVKHWLWLIVFSLSCLVTAQHRLDIVNSYNFIDYFQAWKMATFDEVTDWLQTGSGVNARDSSGVTPLMWAAAITKIPEVIKVLIDAGAEVNARDDIGKTSLIWAAASNENPESVVLLLQTGADATLRDLAGQRAIDYAKDNEALKGTDAYWKLNDASF
jgi:ankyrin repeat protein